MSWVLKHWAPQICRPQDLRRPVPYIEGFLGRRCEVTSYRQTADNCLQTANRTATMTPGQEMGSPSTWLPDATLNINGEAFLNGGNLTLSRLLFAADVNLNIADRLLVQGDGEFRIQDSAQVDADYLHVGGTTGRLTIGNGTFNANGNITMAGGILERISTIGDFNLGTGLMLTAELDAQVGFLGSYAIDDNTAFEIRSGADLIATTLDIGKTTDGTLTVKNTGSTASFGDVSLGNDNASSSTTALPIDDFAVVTTGNLSVATTAAAGTSATMTVDGSSELTLVGSQPLPHDQTYVPGVAPSDAIVWPDHVLVAERDPDM